MTLKLCALLLCICFPFTFRLGYDGASFAISKMHFAYMFFFLYVFLRATQVTLLRGAKRRGIS